MPRNSLFSAMYLSPIGSLKITTNEEALLSVDFMSEDEVENDFEVMANEVSNLVYKQLDEYFKGQRTLFDLPITPEGTDFQLKVWSKLLEVPFGQTCTYLQIAKNLGDHKKSRAVGMANSKNPIAIIVPCHRVIGTNNQLTGYAGGLWRKKWLLTHEMQMSQQSGLFANK